MARGTVIAVIIVIAAAVAAIGLTPSRTHPVASSSPSPLVVPTASPSPTPSAVPLVDYGPPPTGVPFIYAGNQDNPLWITAFDWNGKPRGTIKLSAPLRHELVVEPHCYVLEDQQTFDDVLYTVVDGQPPKRIAVIGNEGSLGQTSVDAVECNFHTDRAVAVRTAIFAPSDVWLLRLTDGAKLGHWSYANAGVRGVVPSTDGTLIAENEQDSVQIRSLPDGQVVAALEDTAVYGFSGDDRFVIEGPVSTPARIRLVDWRTGREVWRSAEDAWPDPVQVAPSGGDVVIAAASKEQEFSPTQDYSKPLIIVHPDGTENDIPGRYWPFFPPYADGNYPYKGGSP